MALMRIRQNLQPLCCIDVKNVPGKMKKKTLKNVARIKKTFKNVE